MAEIKNGTVESVQQNGTWSTKDGSKTFYKFEVSFQDGTVGEYSSIHKEQNKFEVGATLDYEYQGGKFPKIKPVYAKPSVPYGNPSRSFGKSDDVQVKIVRQSMLKASVDFWAITPQLKPTVKDILITAKKFIDFVNEEDNLEFSEEFTHTGKSLEQADLEIAQNTEHLKSDLPF
jgi:hypothetical protein|tara:strand:- start:8 stop:532 length:525 start_codon:yes stop_codon:yes gene_type:complete